MELKTKYQYTNFIYPYLIDETKYQKYILRLLKYKDFKLKIFEKEKDLDIYNFFVPKMRDELFPTFELRGEKLREFGKMSFEEQSKYLARHHMICFEYYMEKNIQGKMIEKEGIFFDIEKIEIISFDTGVCFLCLKAQVDDTDNFSDVLDFNYRFKFLSSEFSNLKDYEKIKLQTSTFKDVSSINDFIKNVTGINIKNNLIDEEPIGDSQFYNFSYLCIESDKWNEKNSFSEIQNEFLKYANVLPSTFISDFDKENMEQNLHIIERMKYYKTAITKSNCNLMCSGVDPSYYTKLPYQYENQYFYTYILALYKKIFLKKLSSEFRYYERIPKTRIKFVKFVNRLWDSEITSDDDGSLFYKTLHKTLEIDDLYNELETKYNVLYKDLKIEKNTNFFQITIILLIFSLIINTVNIIFLMYLSK